MQFIRRWWHNYHVRPFADIIEEHLRRTGGSAITLAQRAGLNRDAIRSVLRGRSPSIDRAAKICEALDLVLRIEPRRDVLPPPYEASVKAMELMREAECALDQLRSNAADIASGFERHGTDYRIKNLDEGNGDWRSTSASFTTRGDEMHSTVSKRAVSVVRIAAAAGDGSEIEDEQVTGNLWFGRDWLDRHGLDPTRCVVISAVGESMEPTIWHGASILVDRERVSWRSDRIFVIRTQDGLVVKRAGKDSGGGRILMSDHPAWETTPFPDDAEVVGQVVWTGRSLTEGSARNSIA